MTDAYAARPVVVARGGFFGDPDESFRSVFGPPVTLPSVFLARRNAGVWRSTAAPITRGSICGGENRGRRDTIAAISCRFPAFFPRAGCWKTGEIGNGAMIRL